VRGGGAEVDNHHRQRGLDASASGRDKLRNHCSGARPDQHVARQVVMDLSCTREAIVIGPISNGAVRPMAWGRL
jgi:hypothetical protein